MFVHVPGRRKASLAWATPVLVLASMAAFVWLASVPDAERGLLLARWGTVPETLFSPAEDWLERIVDGRLLTLVTALFMHADWLHLLGNMLFLVIFGVPAERALAPWRFLLLFLGGGALANVAAAWSIDHAASIIVGASGAVSAIIGAYLALFPRARLGLVLPLGLFLEFVRTPASLLIGIWAGLQLLFTFVGPAFGPVAWSAHISGFLVGVLFGLLSRPAIKRRLRQR